VILPTQMEWAGNAHSSWVELLLAIGIIGPVLAAADVLFVGWLAATSRSVSSSELTLSILVLLVATSVTGDSIAFPGLGFAMLCLIHIPILVRRNSPDIGPRYPIRGAPGTSAPRSDRSSSVRPVRLRLR
jgi:hypothetical protein